MLPVNEWTKCYESGWKDIITPASFQHPAKMAYGLLKRILAHAKEQGWLTKGNVVVDCFGGVGTTGILGAYEGYRVVCVELEKKFVDLAIQNFEIHKLGLNKLKLPEPVILQGDSRRLCEVVEKADCIVSSPPYVEAQTTDTNSKRQAESGYWAKSTNKKLTGKYSEQDGQISAGNLGAMKPGKVDAIISSPPYGDAVSEKHGGKDPNPEMAGGSAKISLGYSSNEENLGNLKSGDVDCVISSPPFSARQPPSQIDIGENLSKTKADTYGYSESQMGKMKIGKLNLDSQTDSHIIQSCKNVKHAEKQSDAEVDGVNPVPTNTLAKSSKAGKSPQDMPSVSQRLGEENQCRTIGGQNIKTGKVAEKVGGDILGDNKELKHLNETDINVAAVNHNDTCKSITKKTLVKPVENGTILSKISKQYVPDAISKNTDRQNTSQSALFVEKPQLPKAAAASNVAPQNVSENPKDELQTNTEEGTFWEAAREIVQQCHQILKPGGYAIWVVKSFVRNKKIVDFPSDWQRLCESVGFKTVCIHHAMLVKETEHKTLFGHTEVKRTERKSFFRRLAESKGSPRIDYEVVLCMLKET